VILFVVTYLLQINTRWLPGELGVFIIIHSTFPQEPLVERIL